MQENSFDSPENPTDGAATASPSSDCGASCAEMGLRERKRRLTRLRIEDEATRLFLERSYHSVTLEDICSAAEISRRTFFNYFDSKDHVALGVAPPPLTTDDVTTIEETLKTAIDNGEYFGSQLFRLFLSRYTDQLRDSDGAAIDPQLATDIAYRRAKIREQNPELTVTKLSRFYDLNRQLRDTLTKHLEQFPQQRQFPDEFSASEEAFLIVASSVAILWASSTSTPHDQGPEIDQDRTLAIARAMGALHRFMGENDKDNNNENS